jgi:hypothetical protein
VIDTLSPPRHVHRPTGVAFTRSGGGAHAGRADQPDGERRRLFRQSARTKNCDRSASAQIQQTRHMLIFVACLVVGTILIGVGMAYVIRVKQRIFPSSPTNASLTRSDAPLRACRCARLSLTAYSILESRGSDSRGSDIVLSESRELHHVTHNPRYRFTRLGYACCAVLATLFDSVKVISKTPLVRRSV